MYSFKLGDKVFHKEHNRKGIIIKEGIDGYYGIGVDFGKGFDGHYLGGKINTPTGWWCSAYNLELVSRIDKEYEELFI